MMASQQVILHDIRQTCCQEVGCFILKVYSKDLRTANIVSMKENILRSFLGPLIIVHVPLEGQFFYSNPDILGLPAMYLYPLFSLTGRSNFSFYFANKNAFLVQEKHLVNISPHFFQTCFAYIYPFNFFRVIHTGIAILISLHGLVCTQNLTLVV